MKRCWSILGIILCSAVMAQGVEDTISLPEVTVTAVSPINYHEIQIDSSQIENPVNANLGELIQQNSSAFVRSYGIGSVATVSFRGAASSHSQLLWNGIALNSSTNGVVDFSLFPTELFQNVSTIEGISSLQNNSGALGGMVQLKQELNPQEGLNISHSLGSYGWNRSHMKYTSKYKKWTSQSQLFYTRVNNNFEFTDLGSPNFPQKELQNASLEQLGVKQDVLCQLSDKHHLGLELWYFDSFRQLPTIFTVNNAQEEQEDRSLRVQMNGRHYYKRSSLRWATSFVEDEILYQNFTADLVSISENKSWRSYAQFEREVGKKLMWTQRLNIDFDQAQNDGFEVIQSQNRVSYFTDLTYRLIDQLQFNVGGRLEYIAQNNLLAMPFARIAYEGERYQLVWNGGRNVKYPNLNDLYWVPGGNPDLEAEESLTTDFTVKYNFPVNNKLKLNADFTAFYNHIDQYILWKPSRFGYWQAENLEAVYSRGLNAKIESQFTGKIKKQFVANYTFTQSRSLHQVNQYDLSKNKQLIYLPEHQLTAALNVSFRKFFLNLNHQFFSARYTASDHSEFLPHYQIFDLTVGNTIQLRASSFQLSMAIQNLLDEDYQAIAWRPMPGRNYLLKLAYALPK